LNFKKILAVKASLLGDWWYVELPTAIKVSIPW
jgi:hypothetical protein